MTDSQKKVIKDRAKALTQINHLFASPEYLLANIMSLTARIAQLEAKAGVNADDALAGILTPAAPAVAALDATAQAQAKAEADKAAADKVAAEKSAADAKAAAAAQAALLSQAPL